MIICGKQKQDIYCILGRVNDEINLFQRYIIETLSHTGNNRENGYGSFWTHVLLYIQKVRKEKT